MIRVIKNAVVLGLVTSSCIFAGHGLGALARVNFEARYPWTSGQKTDFVYEFVKHTAIGGLSVGSVIGGIIMKHQLKGQMFQRGIHTYYALTDDEIEIIKSLRGTVYE